MAKKTAESASPKKEGSGRTFYVICPQDRSDLDCVDDFEPTTSDTNAIEVGEDFDGSFPPDFRIWLDRRKPTDLLGGPQCFVLVSDRFVKATAELLKGQVEVFDIPLFDRETKKPRKGYKLLHVLGCLKAAARIDGKLMVHFSWGIVFEGKKIKPETHIFRMCEAKTYIVVSGELRKALKAADLVGIEYLKTSTV
jgi:hypothetical protein